MKRELVVKEEVENQLSKTALWYDQQQQGLGSTFFEEWENTTEYISNYAEGCAKKYKEFRHAMLKRFPYLVVYEIEGNNVIIYALIYAGRHPSKRYKKS
jgi:mRNA-degrading endonuclease RelE of RelBE toxin-antitoxin system